MVTRKKGGRRDEFRLATEELDEIRVREKTSQIHSLVRFRHVNLLVLGTPDRTEQRIVNCVDKIERILSIWDVT